MTDLELIMNMSGVKQMAPFGSQYVGCATEKSDYDYLILIDQRPQTDSIVGRLGFYPDAADPLYGTYFSSWRKDNVNLVFTDSEIFYNSTIEARDFCKEYKVYNKDDRVKVHEAFRAQALDMEAINTDDLFS